MKIFKFRKVKFNRAAKATFLILSAVLLYACPFNDDYEFEYTTIVGKTPVNLEMLNTQYDDFNSDLPYAAHRQHIYFSTNRKSNGNNFDIIYKYFDISYHEKDDVVDMDWPIVYNETKDDKLLNYINTENDELGPMFLEGSNGTNYYFYANNDSGDFNIQYCNTYRKEWGYNGLQRIFGPVNLNSVNSDFDDLYPTFNNDYTEMYFCSNRENEKFDIYKVSLNCTDSLHTCLSKVNSSDIIKESNLSGNFDDKCPVISVDYLFFTSNREGGFGGFDLYYSKRENNQWTQPVNFGSEINSAEDEYRPFPVWIDGRYVIIFSSNRPGGKGGFDLYGVRIDDLLEGI